MASFQLTLRTRNIQSDRYPVIARVIHNRKSKELVVLSIKVPKKAWDEKTPINKIKFYTSKLLQ